MSTNARPPTGQNLMYIRRMACAGAFHPCANMRRLARSDAIGLPHAAERNRIGRATPEKCHSLNGFCPPAQRGYALLQRRPDRGRQFDSSPDDQNSDGQGNQPDF